MKYSAVFSGGALIVACLCVGCSDDVAIEEAGNARSNSSPTPQSASGGDQVASTRPSSPVGSAPGDSNKRVQDAATSTKATQSGSLDHLPAVLAQYEGTTIPVPATAPRQLEPLPYDDRPVTWIKAKIGGQRLVALMRRGQGKAIVAGHPRYIFGKEVLSQHWRWLNPPKGAAFYTNQPYQAEQFPKSLAGAERWRVKRFSQWSELQPKPGDVVHIRTNTALKPRQIEALLGWVKSGVNLLIQLEMEAREKQINKINTNSAQLIAKKLGVRFTNAELPSWRERDTMTVASASTTTSIAKTPAPRPKPSVKLDASSQPGANVPVEPSVIAPKPPEESAQTEDAAKLIADFFVLPCPAPEGMEGHLVCEAMAPDGRLLAGRVLFDKVGDSQDAEFAGVGLWDIVEQGPPVVMRTPTSLDVWDLQFSPDGKRLSARGSVDDNEEEIRLYTWDVAQRKAAWKSDAQHVFRFTWTDFGAVVAERKGVRLVDSMSGKTTANLALDEDTYLNDLAYDPVGKLCYIAADRFIYVVDLETRRETRRLSPEGESSDIRKLAISEDGRYVAGAFRNGAVLAWETKSGQVVGRWKGDATKKTAKGVALIPNSDRLWIQSGSHFDIHDLTQKTPSLQVKPPASQGRGFWTPDGRQLVLVASDRVVIYDFRQAWGEVDGAVRLTGKIVADAYPVREWTSVDGRKVNAKFIRSSGDYFIFQLPNDALGRNREWILRKELSMESRKAIGQAEQQRLR